MPKSNSSTSRSGISDTGWSNYTKFSRFGQDEISVLVKLLYSICLIVNTPGHHKKHVMERVMDLLHELTADQGFTVQYHVFLATSVWL